MQAATEVDTAEACSYRSLLRQPMTETKGVKLNQTLEELVAELDRLSTHIETVITDARPFNIAHSSWNFPGLAKSDLIAWVEELAQEIREKGPTDVGHLSSEFTSYVQRLKFVRENTIANIWGNPPAGVTALKQTLDGLHSLFVAIVPTEPPEDATRSIKRLSARLAAMHTRIESLEPKTESLETMVSRIEAANAAADALPEDLKSLEDARKKLALALERANTDATLTERARNSAESIVLNLDLAANDAKKVLDKCEASYSAATSQGLARAFSERSNALSISMWFWAFALAAALGAGVKFGGEQLSVLAEAIKGGATGFSLGAALILAMLKLGGPIWFAWLATKQVGQRFRLAEDYAFKASISSAYEGYRKEAAKIDPEMEKRLLASALDRLDEQPLRLVEQQAHGSPWQEAVNSEQVRQAIAKGPEFARIVKDAAASFLRGPEPATQHKASASISKTNED